MQDAIVDMVDWTGEPEDSPAPTITFLNEQGEMVTPLAADLREILGTALTDLDLRKGRATCAEGIARLEYLLDVTFHLIEYIDGEPCSQVTRLCADCGEPVTEVPYTCLKCMSGYKRKRHE